MTEHKHRSFRAFLLSRTGIVLIGFLIIAGYFLWQEHAVHIQGYLPLILVLALCGGMHFFMHRGHGGHGADPGREGPKAERNEDRR